MKHCSIGYRLWKHLNKKYGESNGASVAENIISGVGGEGQSIIATAIR